MTASRSRARAAWRVLQAQRIGIDPTVMSAPMITTLVDATGLFIYFLTAGVVLGL